MKNPTNILKSLYFTHDDYKSRLDQYQKVIKTKDWEFFQDMILTMKGYIGTEILSDRFTKLPAEEKNMRQIVYYHLLDSLNFFGSPHEWLKEKSRIQQYAQQLGKQLKRSDPKGGK